MNTEPTGRRSKTPAVRTFACTFVPPTIIMFGVLLARTAWGIPVERLTTEPTTVAALPPYVGAISTLGILLWAAAAGILLMGAGYLYEQAHHRDAAFLASSALITGYLCVDDAFTLHEAVLPALGVPELAGYLGIALLAGAYGVIFRHDIRRSSWTFMVLAAGFLGCSVSVDYAWELLDPDRGYAAELLVEDGAKLLGICAWVAYSAMSTRGLIRYHSKH